MPQITLSGHLRKARRACTGLTIRILVVNIVPILLLAGGILYLGQYKESLIRAELETMKAQAQLFATAIAEGAVRPVFSADSVIFRDPAETEDLVPELSRRMVRRLAEAAEGRTRLYGRMGELIGDSHQLAGPGGVVQIVSLDSPEKSFSIKDLSRQWGTWLVKKLPMRLDLPVYVYAPAEIAASDGDDLLYNRANTYPDARSAMEGNISASAWKTPEGDIILFAAAPVQKVKQVLGVILLSRDGRKVEAALAEVRGDVLRVFLAALAITIFLSLYLSQVIAQPLRKLASAAEAVRAGKGKGEQQNTEIPDFGRRGDEIGELSIALRDMTQALSERIDSIERFAADVAHEIKNPLTSLRSAVETASRIDDPAKRTKLMEIVLHDVQRLDRLISDISGASRLDAELSREAFTRVDLRGLLLQLLDAYRKPLERAESLENITDIDLEQSNLHLDLPRGAEHIWVFGNQSRLAQVFQNIISNALSFSPPHGQITIRVRGDRLYVMVEIEDQGSGIPENKLQSVFDRFYTERPQHEAYGVHSGLGLSIARQIIDAHGGQIFAANIHTPQGDIAGARFTVILPTR